MFNPQKLSSGDDVVTLEYLSDSLNRALYLLLGVSGHQRVADEGIVGCYRGSHHGIDEHALLEQIAGHTEGLVVVADEEGDDRR